MRKRIQFEEPDEDINMTPMLDIVFILLIFFIVTASFVKESGLQIEKSTARTAKKQEDASIVVGISERGEIWIDKRVVDVRALSTHIERLRAENPAAGVLIEADTLSTNGLLVGVMDAARQAGIQNVAIAASRPE